MYQIRLLYLFITILLSAKVAFSQNVDLKERTRIEVAITKNIITLPLSKNDITRIKFEGDYITNLYKSGDYFSVQHSEENGYIVIMPTTRKSKFATTIETASGVVQDIEFELKDIPSQTIIFKESQIEKGNTQENKKNLENIAHTKVSAIESLLKIMFNQKENKQYKIIENKKIKEKFNDELLINYQKIYKSEGFKGVVLSLKNISSTKEQILNERMFLHNSKINHLVALNNRYLIKAIAFEKKILKPKENTKLYIVMGGENE